VDLERATSASRLQQLQQPGQLPSSPAAYTPPYITTKPPASAAAAAGGGAAPGAAPPAGPTGLQQQLDEEVGVTIEHFGAGAEGDAGAAEGRSRLVDAIVYGIINAIVGVPCMIAFASVVFSVSGLISQPVRGGGGGGGSRW